MVDGQAGKGGVYRPVNRKKYEATMIRLYGVECPQCIGSGIFAGEKCATCDGIGKVEK